jgi:hypothetical protein
MNTIDFALENKLTPNWEGVEIKCTNRPSLPEKSEVRSYYFQLVRNQNRKQIEVKHLQLFSNILEDWKEGCFHHFPPNFPAADIIHTYTDGNKKCVRFIQVKKSQDNCTSAVQKEDELTCQTLIASANLNWMKLSNDFAGINFKKQVLGHLDYKWVHTYSIVSENGQPKYHYGGYVFYAAQSSNKAVNSTNNMVIGLRILTALGLLPEVIQKQLAESVNHLNKSLKNK